MKKLITALICTIVLISVKAQEGWLRQNTTYGLRYYRGAFDSTLLFPAMNGVPSGIASLKATDPMHLPGIIGDTANKEVYVFWAKDSTWSKLSTTTISGESGTATVDYYVEDSTNTPPVVFPEGFDTVYYLIGGAPSGVGPWAGQAYKIARYVNEVLDGFITPTTSYRAQTLDDLVWHRYNGSTWPITYARPWLDNGNQAGGVFGSRTAQIVYMRYNNVNKMLLTGPGVRLPQENGTGIGIATLTSTGLIQRREPPSSSDTTNNKPLISDASGNIYRSTSWFGSGGGGGSGTVTNFSSGDLSPLFTTSVANSTSTPALSFSLSNAAGGTFFGNNTSSSGVPAYTSTPVLGIPGTTLGTLGLAGNTSGTISIKPQAAAGTYNFNLPTTAGTSGHLLTSGGGGSSAMTWTDPATFQAALTLAAIGSSPNANGASLSAGTFNLQPASASFGGVVTTGTQTFAGAKTFTQASNDALTIDGTWTTTATAQRHLYFNPSITLRATSGDTAIGIVLKPTFTHQASTQKIVALDIDPNDNVNGFPSGAELFAIRHRGSIFPATNSTFTVGTSSLAYTTMYATTMQSTQLRILSGSTMTWLESGGSQTMRLYAGSLGPELQIATNGNLSASTTGYRLNSKGEASVSGGIVIPKLSTPSGLSVTLVGTTGSTTITYKVVARLTNGATTDAGTVTTTTANATMNGTNYCRVQWSEVPGAMYYDVYRTATNGTSPTTTGKIGTYTSTSFFGGLLNDQGIAGDGTTPPTINTTGNIGVGVTTPISTLDVDGSIGHSIATVTTNTTIDATYYTVLVDASGGAVTITLPAVASNNRRIYIIKKIDNSANSVTIDGNSSETIDGATTQSTTTQYDGWKIHCNSSAWYITANIL